MCCLHCLYFGEFLHFVSRNVTFFSYSIEYMNTGTLSKFDVLSLHVRVIRDQIKRRSIFSYPKNQKANIILFFTRNKVFIQNEPMKIFGEKNGVASYFPHMAPSIVRVCAF